MQRPDAFLLLPAADATLPWRIGVCRGGEPSLHDVPRDTPAAEGNDPEADAAIAIEAAATLLDSLGYRGEPVILGLPSRWCLAATVPTADLPRRRGTGRRRSLLRFRLEEYLPAAVESLAADFSEPDGGTDEGSALGVAADVTVVGNVLDALADLGVAVDRVCPVALLVAQAAMADPGVGSPKVLVLSGPEGETDVLSIREGVPTAWGLIRSPPSDRDGTNALLLASYLGQTLRDDATEACGLAIGMGVGFAHGAIRWTVRDAEPTAAVAVRAVGQIIAGRCEPWVDLLRARSGSEGGLRRPDRWRSVRRPLRAAAASGLVLIGCVAAAMTVRTHAYGRREAELLARQADVCRQAIGRLPPPGLTARARLATEARRLAATNGVSLAAGRGGDDPSLASEVPILAALADLLGVLPAEPGGGRPPGGGPRYRLLELQLAPDRVLLEGESRTHGDAESLATGIRRALGAWYSIDAPRTQARASSPGEAHPAQSHEVIGFTIAGRPVAPPPPGRPAGSPPVAIQQSDPVGGG